MKIAITGHRPSKLGNDYALTSPLIHSIKAKIQDYINNHLINLKHDPIQFITGMALGIDTLFAQIAIENEIPFIAAIPCVNHQGKWPVKSRQVYDSILANKLCTKHIVTPTEYTYECMQNRNIWMVDNCNLLIAVWDGVEQGGTWNCIKYAREQGKQIIYINPKLN